MSYNESLNSNSNYPLMSQSEWDNAPWNIEDLPEKNFAITVSCSLSKDTEVTSNNYDETGFYGAGSLNEPYNEYTRSEKTIKQIIDFAKEAAQYFLTNNDFKVRPKYTLKKIADSCEGWTVDEENVEQI